MEGCEDFLPPGWAAAWLDLVQVLHSCGEVVSLAAPHNLELLLHLPPLQALTHTDSTLFSLMVFEHWGSVVGTRQMSHL